MKTLNIKQVFQDARKRKEICRHSIFAFALFYFQQYFFHTTPAFHKKMYEDLLFKKHRYLLWVMFRGSAKTSLARIKVLHAICYGYKKNIIWVGHDQKKASKNLRAIANEMQSNKLLIQDFGQLYYDDEQNSKVKKSRPKQLSQFVTENDITVSLQTTQISTRGDLEQQYRPDFYVLDDIENDKTKRSKVITSGIIAFLKELFGGISPDCDVLILGNRISNRGVIHYLENMVASGKYGIIHDVPVERNGKILWPSRYVFTDKEAEEINDKLDNKKKYVVSLESRKNDLGTASYKQEMLNIPSSEGGVVVRSEWFTEQAYFSKSQLTRDEQGNWLFRYGDNEPIIGHVYCAIDPAVSQKETADDRAIVVGGKFTFRSKTETSTISTTYYVVMKSLHGKWSLGDFAKKVSDVEQEYKPHAIGVESNSIQEVFRVVFQQYGISTKALKPDGDKVRRLNRHTADIEFHRVLFPDDGSCDDLIDEMIDFTGEQGKQDNQVDAFSYFMDLCKENTGGFKMFSLD